LNRKKEENPQANKIRDLGIIKSGASGNTNNWRNRNEKLNVRNG